MASETHHQEPQAPAVLYLGVIAAIVATLILLINVAAQPWGWPQGSVEKMDSYAEDSGHH